MKKALWIVILMLAAAIIPTRSVLAEPDKKPELTGWLVDDPGSWRSFEKNIKLITRVSPHWYSCDANGSAVRAKEATPESRKKTVDLAHRNGVKVIALTSNFAGDWDAVRVEKFLASAAKMTKHAKTLVEMTKADGGDGIDLDYELLKAGDRNNYSQFVEIMAKECHKQGLLLAVALHPKISEPGDWDGAQAQDWKRLGAVVDFLQPMCYDMHWATSEAGPIAPLDWTKKVLDLALKMAPARKIELGVPAYGYDWKGKTSISYTWKEFKVFMKKHPSVKRDPKTNELTLKYDGRETWFVDSKSLGPKFDLAKEKHIRGLGFWRLGGEDPGFWDVVRKQ